MRFLINYLRQCLYKHEFKFHETPYVHKEFSRRIIESNTAVSVTCLKCAYHKNYLKYKD